MASYAVNDLAVVRARELIDARQYVLDSDWGESQPGADAQNAFLERHTWDEYAAWHLGLTGAPTTAPKPATRSCTGTSGASTAAA